MPSQELLKQGMRVRLRGRPFAILGMLLERAGELVTREEFRDRLWPADSFVDFDHGLDTAVNRLREALGDAADNPRFVETVPRRGYRFVAPVFRPETEQPAVLSPAVVSEPLPRLLPVPKVPRRRGGPLVLGALAAVALAAIGLRLVVSHSETSGLSRLAVLPFENEGGGEPLNQVADGITDALIARLAELSTVRVTSWTSALTYRRTTKSLAEIAGELNVDALVKGSVHPSSDRLRIDVQVIDPTSGRTLLARAHEGARTEVLSLERAAARDVAEALHVATTPQERARLARVETVDPRAHEAFLRGRSLRTDGSEDALRKAEVLFEEATRLDPSCAAAYAAWAETIGALAAPGSEAVAPRDAWPRARTAALKALDLDPRLDAAEATLALFEAEHEADGARADGRLRRILAQSPSLAGVRGSRALLLAGMERFDESVSEAQRARELDPWSSAAGQVLGRSLFYARRYESAIVELRRVLELEPMAFGTRLTLARCHWQRREWKRAIPEAERALADSRSNTWTLAWLGYAYGASGDRDRARATLARLGALAGQGHVPSFYRALVHVGLDENDEALADLESARQERSGWMSLLRVEPELDSLRNEPGFRDLLRKLDLPDEGPVSKASGTPL